MKKIFLLLLISMSFISAEESSAKVVYDLTTKELDTFELKILKGIVANKTHYEGALRELDVAVVIHGGAYRFFTKNPSKSKFKDDKKLLSSHKELAKRIKYMADTYEVDFLMCGAAMPKNALTKKDVYDFVKIVPNSTIGLIDRQNEGYAYIPVAD